MKEFYSPDLPEITYLKKLGSAQGMDENYRKNLLGAHLADGEIVYSSKAYGSRHPKLMNLKCDIGWIFVTNKRIFFWADNSKKPHIAINFENIKSCKVGYAIMKQKSLKMVVNKEVIKFGTHRETAKFIVEFINENGINNQ